MLKIMSQQAKKSLINPHLKYKLIAQITLTEKEKSIVSILQKTAHSVSPAPVLRITGGWVRDKLLGRESHDIDVAVSSMSGQAFASLLATQIDAKLHTIESNPDKSKHLETVTTILLGESIDIVNLRSEEYADPSSRVPTTVKFGTPYDDAMRRDATLNALFYNLDTEKVEDYTERGLEDLQQGVLRTPLSPLKTFLDDPLRIVRLVRFAAQFGFVVDDAAVGAINDEVKHSLATKVSHERIGIEMGKLLCSSFPMAGLRLLYEMQLYGVILGEQFDKCFGDKFASVIKAWDHIAAAAAGSESRLGELLERVMCSDPSSTSTEFRRGFYLAVLFHRIVEDMPGYEVKSGKKPVSPVEYIVKEKFHFSKSETELVTKVMVNNERNLQAYNDPNVFNKPSIIGFDVIKAMKSDDYWKLSLVYNYLCVYLDQSSEHEARLRHLEKVYDFVEDNLAGSHSDKAIVDGKKLCELMGRKPGKWLKLAIDEVMKWQLDNKEKSVEECVEYLKSVDWL